MDTSITPTTASLPTPRLLDIKLIADGWIKKYVLTYELPDKTLYTYDCASRKAPDAFRAGLEANAASQAATADAVCIVGLTENDELLMIREFRYPLNSWCIAFPTGLTDETVQIVYAQVTRVADATPERGELIEQFLLNRAHVADFIASNTTPIGTRAQLVLESFRS